MESAALCLDVDAVPSVCAATGPQADQLRRLSAAELSRMAGWVATGPSSYTVGEEADRTCQRRRSCAPAAPALW
jgi:hypothetical protein